MTQFKVTFTNETVNGTKSFSTNWFNNIEDAMNSKWMNEPNAKIETRERPVLENTFAEWKANRNK